MLGVPMLAGDRVVGVIVLWRAEVDPFDERTIGLAHHLRRTGRDRDPERPALPAAPAARAELTRSVDELRALGEISQAVSSSLDLDEVLTTIVTRAVAAIRAPRADRSSSSTQATGLFQVRTCYGTEPELVEALRATRIHLDETFVGRAAASGEPLQAPDLAAEPADPHIDTARARRVASMLVVPLLRERGDHRRARRPPHACRAPFDAAYVDLLETLASQSAVAIHNARVCSASSRASRASSRSRAGTSPSSWPACRTSCGRR